MANRRTLDEQIELALAERDKKDERIEKLLARKRARDDKARTHRLCKRGGLVEKHLPRLALLTDEQFDRWMKKTLLSGYAERILNEILPPSPIEADSVAVAPQNSGGNVSRPVNMPQGNNGGGNAQSGNNTRQTG